MKRNMESRFALNPTNVDIQRSRFSRPHSLKTTFNVGDIIPIYVDTDVLPGDTYQMDTAKVVRMQTLLTPIMDNIVLDTYFFFIPHRLVWKHWKEFMGENNESAWLPTTEYTIPQIEPPSGGWNVGTIADYFGVPTGVDGFSMSALPFRAYALVMNEWFRSTPLTDPLVVPNDETTQSGSNGSSYITDVANGGLPFKAAKFHDVFTSALPSPQRGPDVTLPIVEGSLWPVYTGDFHGNVMPGQTSSQYLWWKKIDGTNLPTTVDYDTIITQRASAAVASESTHSDPTYVSPANLWAYGVDPQVASINQLRTAFQIQKYYERLARGGDRYVEMIKSFFNVTSPDARLQRPEYLGGNRIPININQVVQNSATDSVTPQGHTTAFSLTTDRHSDFTHSFTEHGTVLGVMVARYDHTYQQGLERQFSKKTRFDYYFPVFAHLGEDYIRNSEIFLQADTVVDSDGNPVNDGAFGFQERWYEYRYKPSQVTGEMRSSYTTSLDSWHLADDYSSLPTLSDGWIREDKANVDRTLAVTSAVSNQLFADIFFDEKVTRPMPLYSVPGLIDHF